MHLGERIKEERERLGLNQIDFAALASSTRKTLFNWESGAATPNATVLAAWAAHGLDVLYVVTGQRSPSMPATDPAEQVLLDSYRRCGAQARQNLIQTAALLSAGISLPTLGKQGAAPRGSAGGQQINTASGAVQVLGSKNRVTTKRT
ncbi:helix-turn-helix domain-containing protein [Simplicispira psychrophila]|uniref:helix-turn-helix domain-containing protein n=1 Tax=Simplicispira psychrophila TaxID=80882 RepID=UPI000689F00D|nr:helix-turn-helix transcriptional regulator [Simplicispira psychrophila]